MSDAWKTSLSEVVVIPTFARPELLALTLEKLEQAIDAPDDVRIYLDTSTESRVTEVEYARDTYLPRAQIFHAKPHIKVASGCWNILTAIKSGYEAGASSVYLLEEDVQIYPNRFFSWHRKQTALASCGRRHWDLRWKYNHLYTNPGSCLRKPLLDALIPHINAEYFQDTKAYCDKYFPPWDVSTLDDWLIRRVMRSMSDSLPVYPSSPVCAHIGFRGYGQLDIYANNETDLGKRIERAREILATVDPKGQYARDFESPYFS
jgi:hypothetical protein